MQAEVCVLKMHRMKNTPTEYSSSFFLLSFIWRFIFKVARAIQELYLGLGR